MTNDKLLLRRQFLLSEDVCKDLNNWKYFTLSNYHLYIHPDLDIEIAGNPSKNFRLILIGYFIDPANPKKTNEEILEHLSSFYSLDQIIECLNSLSGRFVLIVDYGEKLLLFHDACGLRSVFYTQYKGKTYVGSQPLIFKKVIPLADSKRYNEYKNSDYFKSKGQDWIPSGCSIYENVFHLVPNHFLNLENLKQIRYWPKAPIPPKNLDEVVKEASTILKNSITAANYRSPLALSLTAGWDSRLLLSASKNISHDIFYYTIKHLGMTEKSNDIKIPLKLSRSLGFEYKIIDSTNEIPENFKNIYEQNSLMSHIEGKNNWLSKISGLYDAYPQNRLRISGNCCEIARCFYYKNGSHTEVDSNAKIISLEDGWRSLQFTTDQICDWFDKVKNNDVDSKVDIMDLFYWEHRMESWQAQHQLEWDIIHETYSPYNNRKLLSLMLGVDTQYRSYPDYLFFRMLIKNLWPKVLKQPINPPPTKLKILKNKLTKKFGLE